MDLRHPKSQINQQDYYIPFQTVLVSRLSTWDESDNWNDLRGFQWWHFQYYYYTHWLSEKRLLRQKGIVERDEGYRRRRMATRINAQFPPLSIKKQMRPDGKRKWNLKIATSRFLFSQGHEDKRNSSHMRASMCVKTSCWRFPFLPDELVIELFSLRRYFLPSAKRKRLEGK
jgi:hypothetical protein